MFRTRAVTDGPMSGPRRAGIAAVGRLGGCVQFELDKFVVKQCRHGVMVWPKQDRVIGAALAHYGEFAEGENRIMARYLRAGDVAVDVGANIGTTALPMARAVGIDGVVLAFEPQPLVAQCLATSLVLNDITNTRLMTMALSASAGAIRMDFAAAAATGNLGSASQADQGDLVAAVALDDLALSRLALLKVDVEGHEWQAFQGARQTIAACQPVVYFEAKRLPGTVASISFFLEQGYRCYWHFAHFYRSDNINHRPVSQGKGVGDMNVLAVPSGRDQPDDLPQIMLADQDWRSTYSDFFKSRRLVMP